MRIVSLDVENVKRLKAVHITPDGLVVQITGKNANGKSSVLDSIAMALGGATETCDVPLRHGAEKGKVIADLGDLVVTRTFTKAGGGTLTVANKDGARYQSPQAILDRLVGKLTLDPLAFSRMPAKQQLETLKQLVGLDFSAMDRDRAEVYAARAAANKAIAGAKAIAESLPRHDGVPDQEISVEELHEDLRIRAEEAASQATLTSDIEAAEQTAIALGTAIEEQRDQSESIIQSEADQISQINADFAREIQEAEKRAISARDRVRQATEAAQRRAVLNIETLQAKQATEQKKAADLKEYLKTAPKPLPVEETRKKILEANEINRKARENQRRKEADQRLVERQKDADELTNRIEQIDVEKEAKLAAATFPIDGLSFNEHGVTYKGVPFSQASSAEQLRASVAIGLAMNPKLRVLLIRDGSLLDSEGLKMLAEIAEGYDAQIWLERCTDGQPIGVVIEDGEVKAAEEE